MKRKSIVIITGLMALALVGVIAMQYYFLRQSYQLQSDLFDSNVKAALNNVVARISKQDAISFLSEKARYQNRKPAPVADSAQKSMNPAFGVAKLQTVAGV